MCRGRDGGGGGGGGAGGGVVAPAIGSPVQSVVALRPVRLGSGVSHDWLGSSARPTLCHYSHQFACYADCVYL